MKEHDCIIFGGRLYATGMDGLYLIKKNFTLINGKRLIVSATGASPASGAVFNEVSSKNLNAVQQTLFYETLALVQQPDAD